MVGVPTPPNPPSSPRVAGGNAAALRALHARSAGLNAKYGLPPKPTSPAPPPAPGGAKPPPVDPYTQQAMAMLNPELLGLKQQQQQYDQQQLAYQAQLTNFYKALGGLLQGQAPAVSAAYNQAAQTIGGLGQGLTGQAQQQFNAENANAQAILARGGQTQAAGYMDAKANPGGAALNPFYSTHALIPGQTLAAQGAVQATRAAEQPGIFAATGRDALTEAIQKAVQGDQQWQQKIADVYAKVPALRQQILTTAQDMELKQRQLHDSEVALGVKNANTKSEIQTRLATIKQKADQLNANIAHWNAQLQNQALDRAQRAQLQSQRLAAQKQLAAYRAEQQKALALWKKQNGIGGSGSSGGTANWGKAVASLNKQAKYLFDHPTTKAVKDPFGRVTQQAQHPKPQVIFNDLWSSYVNPYLQSIPANQRATARQMAKRAVLNAMAAAGFQLPGR